ncbi:DUF2971 domain-containing protein [Akkermansia sp.]|uniref:DUF2971 domain-containing protein n=1 Tax=Akkermansia sp. TaxID=1872421 RepID=UPI0025C4990B|nr:DUF2971 domain-containing protein [Akkermansia sp.]MCC8149593.1 DUF2971 domain-containing protein [Akkermansia sp.]
MNFNNKIFNDKNEKNKYINLYLYTSYENFIKIISNWCLKLILADETNDPFEFRPQYTKDNEDDTLFQYRRFVSEMGFLSFSSNHNSAALWGHYADSHRGVCIEFEFPILKSISLPLFPCKIHYLDLADTPEGKAYSLYKNWLFDVRYDHERPPLLSNEFLDIVCKAIKKAEIPDDHKFLYEKFSLADWNALYLMTQKDPSWSFEEEKRILINLYQPEIAINDNFFVKGYNKYISRIILGLKCKHSVDKTRTLVRHYTAGKSNYDIYIDKAKYSPTKYEIILPEEDDDYDDFSE